MSWFPPKFPSTTQYTQNVLGEESVPIVCALVVVWVPHTHTHNGYTDKLRESSKARGYHTHTQCTRSKSLKEIMVVFVTHDQA